MIFVTLLFVIVYAVIESRHDVYVIKNDKGYNDLSKKWHIYGAWQNFLFILALNVYPLMVSLSKGITLIIISIFLFWQLHDSIIGYTLYQDIFYLSSKGFDKKIRRVFYSGLNISLIRLGVILSALLHYLRCT